MASEVLMSISKDEVERARLASELKYELDTQSKITYAKREGIQTGKKIGEEIGKKMGEEIGKKIGEKIGEKKGEKMGEKKIIDLLKSGKSPEEILRDYDN